MARLTKRMKNWLSGMGAHIATADRNGVPRVVVASSASTSGDDEVRFPLTTAQAEYIAENLSRNSRVAFGPGGIGSVRAAYQFKGNGVLDGTRLVVKVDEIYCTKPGPEAGQRLDILPFAELELFETSRWKDDGPPR